MEINQITTTEGLLEAFKTLHETQNEIKPEEFRYAIYARKSTNESEGKQIRSLPDQVAECVEFGERENLRIVGKPIQEAESAKEPDTRPKFRAMLQDIKAGKYDGIIAWHPDRLSRNMKDAGEIIDLLDKGIIKDLKFVSFSFDNTPSGKLLLGIMFAISKEYSDKLSANVSRGNDRSIGEGKYINRPKHGYYKDGNQNLLPDGENFLFVKNALKMRLQGSKLREIANYLNENGYKRAQKDGSRKLFKWNEKKVEAILKDSVYTGVLVYGKAIVDLTKSYEFVPAISVEDFLKINNLSGRGQFIKLAKIHLQKENVKADLMRGMITCDECGESMSSGITVKKSKKGEVTKYFYYRCDTEDCDNHNKSVRAKVVIDYINGFLEQKPFSTQASYDHYAEEMKRVSNERLLEAKKMLSAFQAHKRKLENKLVNVKTILEGKEEEAIKDEYRNDLKQARKEIRDTENNIDKQKAVITQGKSEILTYEDFLELMEKTTQITRNIRSMKDLDYVCRKLFSNFRIKEKKVIESTLCAPFDELYDVKMSEGGPMGNRTPNLSMPWICITIIL